MSYEIVMDEATRAEKEKGKSIYTGLDGKTYLNPKELTKANTDWIDGQSQDTAKEEEVFSGKTGGYLDTLKAGLQAVHQREIALFKKANCHKQIDGEELYVGPDKKTYTSLEDWQKSFKTYLLNKGRSQEQNPAQMTGMLSQLAETGDDDDQSGYEN